MEQLHDVTCVGALAISIVTAPQWQLPCTMRSLYRERAANEIRWHADLRRFRGAREPRPRVGIEPEAVHVVIDRGAQSARERIVIAAGRIVECDLVPRERHLRRLAQLDAVDVGRLADRAV